jgi:hypothetical protein
VEAALDHEVAFDALERFPRAALDALTQSSEEHQDVDATVPGS